MKIELTQDEARKVVEDNLAKILPMDLSDYDIEIETVSRYSTSNSGGLEITLTKRRIAAVQEAA